MGAALANAAIGDHFPISIDPLRFAKLKITLGAMVAQNGAWEISGFDPAKYDGFSSLPGWIVGTKARGANRPL